jgi:hypothetical protein
MWARISVLILFVSIDKLRVRIIIDGFSWEQGLEDWALLVALGIQIIIYSSPRLVISHGFCDRADTSKNVHMLLPDGSIQYCVTLKMYSIFEES